MIIERKDIRHRDHNGHYNVIIADGLQDVEKAEVPEIHQHKWEGLCRHDSGNTNRSWWGVSGGSKNFRAVARKGYPEGVAAVRKLAGTIHSKLKRPKVLRRKRTKGEFGDEIDIHAVNMGSLDRAWTRTQRAPRVGKKKITLLVQVGANAGVHADNMFWGPVTALVLAEELVKARYAVEIIACSPVTSPFVSKNERLGMIKVKNFHQPINLNSLSIMTLGGFLRYFAFKQRLLCDEVCHGGMGATLYLTTPRVQNMIMDQMPPGTNPVFIEHVDTESEAVKEINRIFKEIQEEGEKVAA